MSLKRKLVIFCLLIGLLPIAAMGVYSVRIASESMKSQMFQQLESIRDAKKLALEALRTRWVEETELFAKSKEVYNSVGMLRDAAMGTSKGKKTDLEDEEVLDAMDYVKPAFAPFVEHLGYADAYAVGDDGRILYAHNQGKELGEDILHGAFLKNSSLATALKQALNGQTVITDVAPYPALDNAPAMFGLAPIYDHVGRVDSIAILRLPLEQINNLMQVRSGMGETGETYLVGGDGLMRSDSVRSPELHTVATAFSAPVQAAISSDTVHKALAGQTGVERNTDFRGQDVLTAYAPLEFAGAHWAILAEIDTQEAFRSVVTLRRTAIILGAVMFVFIFVLCTSFMHYELLNPIARIRTFLKKITEGDMNATLDGTFKNELAALANGVTSMFDEVKERLGFSQGVLKGITFPCVVIDPQGDINYANQALLDMTRKSGVPEDYYGKSINSFFFGGQEKKAVSAQALEKQQHIHVEREISTDDGAKINVGVNATPVYDMDNHLLGVFTLYYDLTDIRAQEQQIVQQNQKITRVAEEADHIANSVTVAAESLTDLVEKANQGAKVQSDRTTETSVSMQQLNATMFEMARKATEGSDHAQSARERASMGENVVRNAIKAIQEVKKQTDTLDKNMVELTSTASEIGGVITLIKDIADQTNLLALNAAIEAARAGEAGRGFAVVADEVRKLAERTIEATAEVSSAISSIQGAAEKNAQVAHAASQAVASSAEFAQESGDALSEIVEIVEQAATQVSAIAQATGEQSQANDTITNAVEDITRISIETAQGMDTSSEAIFDLTQQARTLKSLINEMRN